jgi:hypothetical protein
MIHIFLRHQSHQRPKEREQGSKQVPSILEQIQEVKTTMEQLKIQVELQQKDTPEKAKEGVPLQETMDIIV